MPSDPPRPWRIDSGGIVLHVRLTPRGGRDSVDRAEQLADGRCVLKARVRAAATNGEANEALVRLLAKTLDVPARDVTLASGATSRIKRLNIAGDAAKLAAALERIV